jgi:tRNA(Ile)-lysidine synthase
MDELLHDFREHITRMHLFTSADRLLLAVSGGLDSVVLTELCRQAGFTFGLAHVNFQLRGPESDRDEEFVRQLASRYNKEIFIKRVDTAHYAASKKVSIQTAARELRYTWFADLMNQHPAIRYLLTAHHRDDNIETLLMQFFRGTGISGLRGILPKQHRIIRPLLFAPKEALHDFAVAHQLLWMEDSSNAEDHYTRNYFRHKLIPSLREIFPEVVSNLSNNITRFGEASILYEQALTLHKRKLLVQHGQEIHIPVLKLKKTVPLRSILFEIISEYGFTAAQTDDVLALLDSTTGKQVSSPSHRVIRNRAWLIIAPKQDAFSETVLIESPDGIISYPRGSLRVETVLLSDKDRALAEKAPDSVAWLDAAQIRYPLILRKRKTGDYFYPLGMIRKKKLARFLIDRKLSKTAKEQVWVLEMDRTILWVIGMRIDNRYRITAKTKTALKITSADGGVQ